MSKRSFFMLMELAKVLLKEKGQLSTSYLMRKLRIDYEEAVKIMERL
jgi:DNA segregation ATPase FtsK/SpoIIIE-like protein